MDFVQGIGERYLLGKANAAPQMLENLAKKQFKSAPDPKAEATPKSALPTSDKDEEIAQLRKQLAETRLKNTKASGEVKALNGHPASSIAKSARSEKSTGHAAAARSSGGGAKARAGREMKGSAPPSTIGEARSISPKSKKPSGHSRGRSASIGTATAAKAHKALSEAYGGEHASSKPGSASHQPKSGATGAREALQGGKIVHKAAASASSVHAASHRGHSARQQSDSESEDETLRAESIAGPPRSIRHASKESGQVYEQVVRKSMQAYEDEEPGLYIVEVEEDMPMRKKATRYQGGRGGHGGVVEIQHSQGRTVYKVS